MIVYLIAGTHRNHRACCPQSLQMLGNARLGHAGAFFNAPDIPAPHCQQAVHNLQPHRMGQRLQKSCPLLIVYA